jgi:hypothetical protein
MGDFVVRPKADLQFLVRLLLLPGRLAQVGPLVLDEGAEGGAVLRPLRVQQFDGILGLVHPLRIFGGHLEIAGQPAVLPELGQGLVDRRLLLVLDILVDVLGVEDVLLGQAHLVARRASRLGLVRETKDFINGPLGLQLGDDTSQRVRDGRFVGDDVGAHAVEELLQGILRRALLELRAEDPLGAGQLPQPGNRAGLTRRLGGEADEVGRVLGHGESTRQPRGQAVGAVAHGIQGGARVQRPLVQGCLGRLGCGAIGVKAGEARIRARYLDTREGQQRLACGVLAQARGALQAQAHGVECATRGLQEGVGHEGQRVLMGVEALLLRVDVLCEAVQEVGHEGHIIYLMYCLGSTIR